MAEPKTRTTLTLRARQHDIEPAAGNLMASESGRVIYRIVAVHRVHLAGDPRGFRFRLVCARLRKAEIPEGATILPWITGRRPPPVRRVETTPSPSDPEQLRALIRRSRAERQKALAARLARIGRDVGVNDLRDYGHSILQARIRDRSGHVLREPQVVIEDARDPDAPKRTVRRARRVDPLHQLRLAGSITKRHFDAAERLRDYLQATEPSMGSGLLGEIHIDGSLRIAIGDRQINAWRRSRRALGELDEQQRAIVACMVLGHLPVEACALHLRVRRSTVPELLRGALDRLADHFFGRPNVATGDGLGLAA